MASARRSFTPSPDGAGPSATPPRRRERDRPARSSRTSSTGSLPLLLDAADFKGTFSFDAFFSSLVGDILPPLPPDSAEGALDGAAPPGAGGDAGVSSVRAPSGPAFAEAEALLPVFKDARKELLELKGQVSERVARLAGEVSAREAAQAASLAGLEAGVGALFSSFSRLDNRIAGVGQTAARIGDHLQAADAQKDTALQTIDLIRYLQEFNECLPGDFNDLDPLFTDDARVGEAATVAQKLRTFAEEQTGGSAAGGGKPPPSAGSGLEAAVGNLQEYCNELENRLLVRFDVAAARRELPAMREWATVLGQFNRGSSAMQRYVASRPMFMDVDVMAADVRTATGGGDGGAPARGLAVLYADIVETVKKEAATVEAVFPNPRAVMALLVQRILEQRVVRVLDALLQPPPLPRHSGSGPPTGAAEGTLGYLRTLAAAYERTQELAGQLTRVGCGDLDCEALADSLFSTARDDYLEHEQASLAQLLEAKMAEARAGGGDGAVKKGGPGALSVGVVTDMLRWSEEAGSRCLLLTRDPGQLAWNVKHVFTTTVTQVSQYLREGLERGQETLSDAAAKRERYMIGTSVSRRVAAAAASAAEAAANAGESSVRAFMVAVQRATMGVALLQQHYVTSVARLVLPGEGDAAACSQAMSSAVASAEAAALAGLGACVDTILAEVERLLAAEQKPSDFRPTADGALPDHRPTAACVRVVQYLARIAEAVQGALEGLNKQSFLAKLGSRLHKALLAHIARFTFNPSGGLRLKRDISEYADFVRTFKAHSVDQRFELLGTLVNVFVVAPASLPTLVDGSLRSMHREAERYIQLRDDYKTANIAAKFTATPG
ncbi:exocyst complex component sec10 [Klebsormidium nitens]|uniref:Exocyst complex component sec10 n=1 Tax=Klebsormidium nitens TaxID=105231 RepID=A0A1Y1I0I7_KLENI|nr:exocyst complex component sec10 [Klebsormidium nitens]|eukprot:GAQ82297.1 exocyst complex component sec10 [Klebsormidium nitens]